MTMLHIIGSSVAFTYLQQEVVLRRFPVHTEFGRQSYRIKLQGLGLGLGALRGDLSDHRQ